MAFWVDYLSSTHSFLVFSFLCVWSLKYFLYIFGLYFLFVYGLSIIDFNKHDKPIVLLLHSSVFSFLADPLNHTLLLYLLPHKNIVNSAR